MSVNVVNLDAHLPRADFEAVAEGRNLSDIQRISLQDLETGFLVPQLRKPDFQRETNDWSPPKVLDLVRTFVDGELIPAIILWQAGGNVFVIDGAHRLSALLAWIRDDYGQGLRSQQFFGGKVPAEQERLAMSVKKVIDKEIKTYANFKEAATIAAAGKSIPDPVLERRVKRMATNALQIQWMPAENAEAAQKSFLRINEAATPIDPIEKRLIRAKHSANAITARAIANRGSGYKYWKAFPEPRQKLVEELSAGVNAALFDPPLNQPIKTLDIPIGGYGYNTLPFIFDLVNQCSGTKVPDSRRKKDAPDAFPDDMDGATTVTYLNLVTATLARISGADSQCLGPHPAVYFYTRGGTFQPASFLAVAKLFDELNQEGALVAFTKVRQEFEEFLITYAEFLSQIVHKFGSAGRSVPPLTAFYRAVLKSLVAGDRGEAVLTSVRNEADFKFLVPNQEVPEQAGKPGGSFGRKQKSAAFIRDALVGAPRCGICGARLHMKSINTDHVVRREDGGSSSSSNASPVHPFCTSTVKG